MLSFPDEDQLCILFPQREVISAHPDFDRIAQRRESDKLDSSANQQAHLENSAPPFGRQLDLGNSSGFSDFQGSQW
jgi:hypothetical protein